MRDLRKSIALSTLISLILCHFIAHGFSLHQTDAATTTTTCVSNTSSQDILRGGAISDNNHDISSKTKTTILDFLSANTNNGDFHIQGWRWHFMSLIRDSNRVQRLARHLSQRDIDDEVVYDEGIDALEQAVDYLINFNMAGLHRVEEKMFVGWLRANLCDASLVGVYCENGKDVSNAFREVIDTVDEERIQSSKMGKELYEKTKTISKSNTRQQRRQNLNEIMQLSSQLSERLSQMRELQETFVVPAIALVVPSRSQKTFNNRVLLKLGVLESRVHLVGMHDAVWESGSEIEKKKFETEIPYVARVMIDRWRKSLYNPKAGMLDYDMNQIRY